MKAPLLAKNARNDTWSKKLGHKGGLAAALDIDLQLGV
jgi:hypothetical protein